MANVTLDQVAELSKRGAGGTKCPITSEDAAAFLRQPHLWRSRKDSGTVLSVADITRVVQAGVIWQKLGQQVFGVSLPEYLYGTDAMEPIPSLPDWPETWGDSFDRDVLVDGRIVEKIGLSELCRLVGLTYNGDDKTSVSFDKKQQRTGIRWMRCQAGHKNHNRKPMDCRTSFQRFEVGMDAGEGLAVYVQDPAVINDHILDLPGSVRAGDRDSCACLGYWSDSPELGWSFDGNAHPGYGSASRGSV